MFPNNMEFFVKERIAERYAEAEKYRLGQEFAGPAGPTVMHSLKLKLGRLAYRAGCQMIGWSERLRSSETIADGEQTEQLKF